MKKTLPVLQILTAVIVVILLMQLPVNAEASDAKTQITTGAWGPLQNRQTSTYQVNKPIYQSPKKIFQNKLVVVDPGHGGNDTGAIGPGAILEKNVTMAIAQELRKQLTNQGATVILTRTSDKEVAYPGASDKEELAARIGIANRAAADLFISIHADAFDGFADGTTTYFYDEADNDEVFAHLVQANMVAQLQLYDRGVQQNDYYVLKSAEMPAVLVEAAFISNPQEEKLLANRSFDKKVATGIYNGIQQYFLTQ